MMPTETAAPALIKTNGRTMFRMVLRKRARVVVIERFQETQADAEQDATRLTVDEYTGARVLLVYPVIGTSTAAMQYP